MTKATKKLSQNNYLIKQLPKATAYVNKRMQIVFASDRWISDFNFADSNVLGKTITKLFKNDNKAWLNIFKERLKYPIDKVSTELYIDGNGTKKWFEVQSIPWHDEEENVIGTILQTEDVTEKISNEDKLKKLKIISEQMSDVAEIGFWDYNAVKDEVFWCNKTKAIHEVDMNYKPNIIDATNFYKNGYSRNTILMTLNKAVLEESHFLEKLQLITAKGNEVWVIVSGKPVFENGKFIGVIGTIQNINKLNIAETKRRENEHLLRTLIDNLPLNVFIKDLESRKILINKSELEFCGATDESEVLGKDDFAFLPEDIARASREDDLTVMRDLKPVLGRELTSTYKDGSETTFLTSKIPLIDAYGNAYGLLGFSLDISERIRKEQELKQLIDVTSSQNEKLLNFTHIVSHNLRSHSANFSMLLKFLKDEESPTERHLILKMLQDSSDNLLETLDNLNDIININRNRNLKKETIYLHEKINEITKKLSADLANTGVQIINEVSETATTSIAPTYINSILTNLITNGIRYRSLDRKPYLKLSTSKEENFTVLSIEDNGVGIDLEKYGSKIFGMYKTFHDQKDARGIGLYITKNQIEAMNGKVTVTSEVDKGSIFKVYFNEKN